MCVRVRVQFYTSVCFLKYRAHIECITATFFNKLVSQSWLLQVLLIYTPYCHIFKLTIDDFGIYIYFFLLIYRCCILLSDC